MVLPHNVPALSFSSVMNLLLLFAEGFPTLEQQWVDLLNSCGHILYIWSCNCDAASREHLYSSLDIFDPVRGSRMELWFITGNGSVFLSKVYKVDRKRHGAHCQHIHNFEG